MNPAEQTPNQPPQPPAHSLLLLRAGDIRKQKQYAPGGDHYRLLVESFSPLVVGLAEKLTFSPPGDTTENGRRVQDATESVFQLFSRKWKRLPRRASLAAWFWRTTLYVVEAQFGKNIRRQWQKGSLQEASYLTAERVLKLPRKQQEALLVLTVMGIPLAAAAKSLKTKETRLQKLGGAAQRKIGAALRKRKFDPAGYPLSSFVAQADDALIQAVVEQASSRQPARADHPLSAAASKRWWWFGFWSFWKRVAKGVAITATVLACVAGTFVFLATHGYLNSFFLRQQSREMAKKFPDLLKPARPFPEGTNTSAAVRRDYPKSSSELYSPTNIWLAAFRFTEDQWKGITPSNIPPARLFQDGRIVLRNPHAKRSGLSGMVGLEFNYTEAKLEFGDQLFERIGVRYRGNGTFLNSRHGPKQSLKVDMNEYVKGQKIAGVKTLNFLNCIADDTYMRDILAQRFFADLGAVGPRASYAYITLDVPGKFNNQPLGLFVLMENIDADFAEDRFQTKRVPIFKPVTYELFKDLGNHWSAYAQIYDLKTKASPDQEQRIIDFSRLVTHSSDEEFAEKLPEFLDMTEFAAFLAGHVLLSSYDGFLENGQNYYMYLDPQSNRFGFIPWDQDHSWGEFGYVGTPETRERASIWNPSTYHNRFLSRVMAVEAFKKVYREKLEDALAHYFVKDRLFQQIDELAAQIRPAVAAENTFRLRRFDEAISARWPDGPRNVHGPAEGPGSPVQPIKRFIENRIKSVRSQLDGVEEGVQLKRDR